MNAIDVDHASNDDHLILGTVASVHSGRVVIQVDHCETVPEYGQRVKVLTVEPDKRQQQ